jgi:hypothetical protein
MNSSLQFAQVELPLPHIIWIRRALYKDGPRLSVLPSPGRAGGFPLLIRQTALSRRDAIYALQLRWTVWFPPELMVWHPHMNGL